MQLNPKNKLYFCGKYVIKGESLGDGYYKATRITTGQHRIRRDKFGAPPIRQLIDRLEIYEGIETRYILSGDITSYEGKQDFSFTGISITYEDFIKNELALQEQCISTKIIVFLPYG